MGLERSCSLRDLAPDRSETNDEPRGAPHFAKGHVFPHTRGPLFGKALRLLKAREHRLHDVLRDRHRGHVGARQASASFEMHAKRRRFDAGRR